MSPPLYGRLIARWRHGRWCHRCGKGPCFYSTHGHKGYILIRPNKTVVSSFSLRITTKVALLRIISNTSFPQYHLQSSGDGMTRFTGLRLLMNIYRRMLTFSRTMKITQIKRYWDEFSLRRLLADIRKKRMGYFGHIIRRGTLQHTLLEGTIGTAGGRSRTMWMGNITEWSGLGYVEAARKAQDRNYWRQLIASDPALDGTWRWRRQYIESTCKCKTCTICSNV